MVYTALHHLIEQGKWGNTVKALGDDPNTYEPMMHEAFKDDLPLHLACERRAPPRLILALLEMYDGAASCRGKNENLPLHIAIQKSLDFEIIEALIRINPYVLDERNNDNYTPRDYGHKDAFAYQAIGRPTQCWHQLMKDEVREEHQDSRLHSFHTEVDKGLNELNISNYNLDDIIKRLEVAQTKLEEYESLCAGSLSTRVMDFEQNFTSNVENLENRICAIEDEAKASLVKDSIAIAAAKRKQAEVIRIQEKSATLTKEVANGIAILNVDMHITPYDEISDLDTAVDEGSAISASTNEILEKVNQIQVYISGAGEESKHQSVDYWERTLHDIEKEMAVISTL